MNDILSKIFKDKIKSIEESDALLVNVESWFEIATFIKSDNKLSFDYLMSITSYDLGDSIKFGVAYNFYSTKLKHYLEIRIEVEELIDIPSIVSLWRTADWHEREAYDLMGVKFKNHPDLKRILLPEDWEGHPLRKNYKTPDFYNGMPVPKDKSYWE